MMEIKDFSFSTSDNVELTARLYYKDKLSKRGVIFSHGLFSCQDGNKIRNLAEPIVNTGSTLMTFNFRFSTASGGNISEILIADELKDLLSAIEYLRSQGIEEIHLMGSSVGGLISIMAAGNENIDVSSLILIATPVDLADLPGDISREEMEALDPSGYRCYKGVMLNNRFFRELVTINVISSLKSVKCPVLAIHGSDDRVVNIENYHIIKNNIGAPFKGIVIDGGDHRLFGKEHFELLSNEVTDWLKMA